MLKLGIYSFEKTKMGFIIYTTVKDFFHEDGSPFLERAYFLNFYRWGDGNLVWQVYNCRKFKTISGEKAPKTIAQFASAICTGSTIFNF